MPLIFSVRVSSLTVTSRAPAITRLPFGCTSTTMTAMFARTSEPEFCSASPLKSDSLRTSRRGSVLPLNVLSLSENASRRAAREVS